MEFSFSRAGDGDVEAIHALMACLERGMPNPDHFVVDTREYVADHVEREGFILLARDGDALAGFLIVDLPGVGERNLAYDLGWPCEAAETGAHMDIAGVSPAYRGCGLQRMLMVRAEEMLIQRGMRAFFSTVHPENAPSLNNLFALGYRIGATKLKYGGVPRHILYKRV